MEEIFEAIILTLRYTVATLLEKVYRVTYLCSVSASSFFGLSSARRAA